MQKQYLKQGKEISLAELSKELKVSKEEIRKLHQETLKIMEEYKRIVMTSKRECILLYGRR